MEDSFYSRKRKNFILKISTYFILCSLLIPSMSMAEIIVQIWYSLDRSIATVISTQGETITLPKKGGGNIVLTCRLPLCITILKDFKKKSGKVTYSSLFGNSADPNSIPPLQTLEGTIDEGVGQFEITTSGFEGLFDNVTVTANLIESTGFTAQVGLPGDQIPQGGSLSYSTKWFSDEPIGIDPVTGDEIILGEFFLDSAPPLEAFEYSLSPSLQVNFTTGQVYKFSSGLEIEGTVTKRLLAEVESFTATAREDGINLTWVTSNEVNSAGFRILRGAIDKSGQLEVTVFNGEEISFNQETECIEGNLTPLKTTNESELEACETSECRENKLRALEEEISNLEVITARGSEREDTCYSYLDTNANNEGWTYYYLLEEIEFNGNKNFHWDNLTSPIIGSMN